MLGRQVIYAEPGEENGFLPLPDPAVKADIVYLCSPNNPTGAVYSREQLAAWVDYAKKNDAVILYDAAYECFIRDDETPHSIFESVRSKCAPSPRRQASPELAAVIRLFRWRWCPAEHR